MGIFGVIILVVGIIFVRRERQKLIEELHMIENTEKS